MRFYVIAFITQGSIILNALNIDTGFADIQNSIHFWHFLKGH